MSSLSLYSGVIEIQTDEKQKQKIGFVCMATDPDDVIDKINKWPIFKDKTLLFKKIFCGMYKDIQRPPGQYHKGVWWNVKPNQS